MKILGLEIGDCQASAQQKVECAVVSFNDDDTVVLISLKQMPNQIRLWNAMQNGPVVPAAAAEKPEKAKKGAKVEAEATAG